MEHRTTKTPDESWEQYVQRLVDQNYLTEQDQAKWRAGKSRKWKRSVQVTRFDVVLRTRLVQKKTKQSEQVYGVVVPVAEFVKGTLKLPKPGTEPDDVPFEGFLNLDGDQVVTRVPEPGKTEIRNRERELKKRSPEVLTRKSGSESWQQYAGRLVDEKFMTAAQLRKWRSGKPVALTIRVPQTVMMPQTQLRGRKKVTVEVPVRRTKLIEIELPALQGAGS